MLLPSNNNRLFPRSLDIFDDDFFSNDYLMKSDITVKDGNYIMEIELPGLDKKDINIDYHNGYLTVSASHEEVIDEEKEYIHKERYYGSYKRSFYVGDIDEKDIKAKYKDGILNVTVPKEEEIENTKRQIEID